MNATRTRGRGTGWRQGSGWEPGLRPGTTRGERPDVHALGTESIVSFDPDGHALHVRCEAGKVWVTQSGDGRDVVLSEGQEFVSMGEGKVVVQALEPARLVVKAD